MTKRVIGIFFMCITLGACAEQIARHDAAIDDIKCNYAPAGSQAYLDCRKALAITHAPPGNVNVNVNR
jgi:hypothetical protein